MPSEKIWRFLPYRSDNAFRNMALDETLFLLFKEGESLPVLRLYGWSRPAVSVGRFQDPRKILNIPACIADGIHVVRRPTGGGAVYHDKDMTYCVVCGADEFKKMTVAESYRRINSAVVCTYKDLGVKTEFQGPPRGESPYCLEGRERYDFIAGGKKLGGGAQRRSRAAVLQHGFIPADTDFSAAGRYFGRDPAGLAGGAVSLKGLGFDFPAGFIAASLKKNFKEVFGARFEESEITSEEKNTAEKLLRSKYSPRRFFPQDKPVRRLPPWMNKKVKTGDGGKTGRILSKMRLNTICREALCPNITECFERGTATFLILGRICTRKCRFCGVKKGIPLPPVGSEPERVARAAAVLGLKHVVVTSPTRDDLPDGGASAFAATAAALKKNNKSVTIELLVPDFAGNAAAIETVASSGAGIIGHNLETVKRLYGIRAGADYERSLGVLESLGKFTGVAAKSGIMLGLGEKREEVEELMRDLISVGCRLLSIGQYLSPGAGCVPVEEYVEPEEFEHYGKMAAEMGFLHVESSPYTRSSYRAREYIEAAGGNS